MKRNLIFSFLIIILFGCHKYNEHDYVKDYISSAIKSQAFKIGSYWVYKNDSTQKTDCTYIYNIHYDWYESYWGLGHYTLTEHYDIYYNYKITPGGTSHYWDRIEHNGEMRNPVFWYNGVLRGPYVYVVTDTIGVGYGGGITFIDSLEVGSRTFYKVQKATIDSTDWYTAKSIGVVRKVVHDSIDKGTWNLLRWKIVK